MSCVYRRMQGWRTATRTSCGSRPRPFSGRVNHFPLTVCDVGRTPSRFTWRGRRNLLQRLLPDVHRILCSEMGIPHGFVMCHTVEASHARACPTNVSHWCPLQSHPSCAKGNAHLARPGERDDVDITNPGRSIVGFLRKYTRDTRVSDGSCRRPEPYGSIQPTLSTTKQLYHQLLVTQRWSSNEKNTTFTCRPTLYVTVLQIIVSKPPTSQTTQPLSPTPLYFPPFPPFFDDATR